MNEFLHSNWPALLASALVLLFWVALWGMRPIIADEAGLEDEAGADTTPRRGSRWVAHSHERLRDPWGVNDVPVWTVKQVDGIWVQLRSQQGSWRAVRMSELLTRFVPV